MPLFAKLSPDVLLLSTVALAIWAFVAVWAAAFAKWRQRRPVIPYQPRRPVPWGALDLSFVMLIFLAAQACVLFFAAKYLGADAVHAPAAYDPDKESTLHAALQLMAEADAWVLLLCGFSVIVAAPVAEEFLFRVVLQGWLESLEGRHRRRMPALRRLLPRAVMPIALASFLFAMMHFRVDGPPIDKRFLVFMMAGNSAAGLLTVALAVLVLRWRVGATAADFGWSPSTIRGDVRLGLTAFAAVAVPIYAVQFALILLLPKYVAADPIALFLLALVLGTLFYRTHRIVPAIVLHASLNATSFLLAWLGSL
ncbi:MAG: CPBP family intramembrane metalloprotease [Pirellulales bacterium]|nr:CPBP family intramembrane metalloprotease [Pirellulales bacterium]